MGESVRPSRSVRLYRRLVGVDPGRLGAGVGKGISPRVRDVLYYAYRKGFWSYLRGLRMRPRLGGSRGRFFLGRRAQILFPGRLKVGRNVAIGDYVYMN